MNNKQVEQLVFQAMGFNCSVDETFGIIGITSLDFIRGIVKIEDVLGIEFPDWMLVMNKDKTICKFINEIEGLIADNGKIKNK